MSILAGWCAMPLIVDGYNVLHTTFPPSLAGLDTGGLCRVLAKTPWAREGVDVVCDGRPAPSEPAAFHQHGVRLHFSGTHQTADKMIVQMIERHTAPRRLTVVSSDHAIRRAARRRRARVWTSDEFVARLVAALRAGREPGGGGKPDVGKLPESEVRRWLRAFGLEE